ncbi:MAG: hypothetical protein D6767_05390 [Candidatus Hydrogenedentota bacterium]|nr:MAG: hypothetical protein D6767_05390 [Candidatus Hydrogenedentota bacterium]
MLKKWKIIGLGLFFTLGTNFLYSANASSSAEFLTIDPNPRFDATGGAYTASLTDISGMNINPASTAFLRVPEVYINYKNILQEFHHIYFSTGTPLGVFFRSRKSLPKRLRWLRKMRTGLSFQYLGTSDIEVVGNESNAVVNTISARDLAVSLGAGYNIRGYRIGGNIKVINRKLADYTGTTFAFDLGVLKGFDVFRILPYPVRYNLRVGLAVLHIGPGVTFSNDQYKGDSQPLPLTVRPAVSYGIFGNRDHRVDFNFGLTYLLNEPFAFNTGVEYRVFNIFYLRLGGEIRTDEFNFTMGTGARYTFRKVTYRLDYSYLPRAHGIPDNHNVSLMATLSFIKVGKKKRVTSLGILEGYETKTNKKKKKKRRIKIKNR